MTALAAPPTAYVGASRGARRDSYFLMTPENHFPARLPELRDTVVRKLVTPRAGRARFGQYLLEIEPGGGTVRRLAPGREHFVFVLEGEANGLAAGGFAYSPAGLELHSASGARVLWITRVYERAAGIDAPAAFASHRDDLPAWPTSVPGLDRAELLPPDDPAFDFNVSLLGFVPGTRFHKVEVHDEEHGLYVTAGQGVYHLDGDTHEVLAEDFVYMAPYCPQSFYAVGPERTEYLLYKDVWRDGF